MLTGYVAQEDRGEGWTDRHNEGGEQGIQMEESDEVGLCADNVFLTGSFLFFLLSVA